MCKPNCESQWAGCQADNNENARHTPPNNKQISDDNMNNNDAIALDAAEGTLDRGTFLVCVSILLLISGMSITYPHMQSRRDELGCDSLCYGTMTSVRSALGLIGTALVGRLSDRNGSVLARTLGSLGTLSSSTGSASGRRACLYLGTFATLVGLTITASMHSLRGLWLSMMPDALLQHNFDVFKALLSEYHNDIDYFEAHHKNNEKENDSKSSSPSRSGSVGKLGMAVGISFMIGPMIAAVASPSFQVAIYFAIICTIFSGIVIYHLPLPVRAVQKHDNDVGKGHAVQSKTNAFSVATILKPKTRESRAAMMLLVLRLNMSLAFQIFNTIWPASLKSRFNFGPSDHAKFMSFIGITYAFSQGFLAKRLVTMGGKDGKVKIIMLCCAILGVGRFIAYTTRSIVVVYITFCFIINALGTMNTVITADTGSIAPSDEIGAMFGILQAAESAAGIGGPFIGGVISRLGTDAPLFAVVGIYSFLFVLVYWGYAKYVVCNGTRDGGEIEVKMKKVD
jgi:MFS family permease